MPTKNIFDIKLKFKKMIKCNCLLGEGLFLYHDEAVWVDIEKDKLFIKKNDSLSEIKLDYKPSVILNISETSITIGCDIGIISFDRKQNQLNIVTTFLDQHEVNNFRSNDGCLFNDFFLIGFMHRNDTDLNAGYLYSVIGEKWNLLDNTIHIPNTFLKISDNSLLISDSHHSQIWKYTIDEKGKLLNKHLWAQLDENMTPDGGCLINNLVVISLWDGACLLIFDIDGKVLGRLNMPVIRPTNCKYNSKANELWVTSASIGLSKKQIKSFPYSGSTFVFDVEKRICK